MDFRDSRVDIGDGDMSAHDQLGLKWDSEQLLGGGGTDITHVKSMKDPAEDQFPTGDRLFILLHVEQSRGCTPFAQFDDLPLDIRHSAASQNIVRVVQMCVFGFTNVINSPTASRTDWLRLPSGLPSMARSRVVHTLAHANPSSTYSA